MLICLSLFYLLNLNNFSIECLPYFKDYFLITQLKTFFSFQLILFFGCLPNLQTHNQEQKMKKIRKGTQLSLTNPKRAGRPAIQDKGIRHRKREVITKPRPLHLTIKLIRADIQNKTILKGLRHAIQRARAQGLKIIHYSLERDHVHLYAEGAENQTLAKAMKALGVSFVRRINRYHKTKGSCYKTRYHLRILNTAREVKNVINYILKNGIKHGRTKELIDTYNSAFTTIVFVEWLDKTKIYRRELEFI
jgi:REP element-mobilizing transposase RayT